MVIAKLRRMGNCFLLNLKGSEVSSYGDIGILGMNTLFPACSPPTIFASIALSWKALIISRVPLHRPLLGSRLRSKMTGQLIFTLKICGGKPFGVIEFRKSIV